MINIILNAREVIGIFFTINEKNKSKELSNEEEKCIKIFSIHYRIYIYTLSNIK